MTNPHAAVDERFDKLPHGQPVNGWSDYITVANALSFIHTELDAARAQAFKEAEEIVEIGGTGDTILTFQHNGEPFVNRRQLLAALRRAREGERCKDCGETTCTGHCAEAIDKWERKNGLV